MGRLFNRSKQSKVADSGTAEPVPVPSAAYLKATFATEQDDIQENWRHTAAKKVPYIQRHDGEERVLKVTTMQRVTETMTVTEAKMADDEEDPPHYELLQQELAHTVQTTEKKQPLVVRPREHEIEEGAHCCCRVWPARDYREELISRLNSNLGRAEIGADRDIHIFSLADLERRPTMRTPGAHRLAQRIVEPAIERFVHRVQPIDYVVERRVIKRVGRPIKQTRTKYVERPVERVHWIRNYTYAVRARILHTKEPSHRLACASRVPQVQGGETVRGGREGGRSAQGD